MAEPRFALGFDGDALLRQHAARTIDELWGRLAARPHAADTSPRASAPNADGVRGRAATARRREVDLLGSGPTQLGTPIDWHTDFKSGFTWSLQPAHKIAYTDLGKPNDVKVPWELSRLQWLVPVGAGIPALRRRAGRRVHARHPRRSGSTRIRISSASTGRARWMSRSG